MVLGFRVSGLILGFRVKGEGLFHVLLNALLNGFAQWLAQWITNNWRNSKKKEIKNMDLWKQIYSLSHMHQISSLWVKGHNNHKQNEKADYLARLGMKEFKD